MISFKEILKIAPIELQERLELLKNNPENLIWHPEGNTYDHIKIVTDRLCQTKDMDLIMAGFFHDLFKLETTKLNPKTNQPCAYGHEVGSAKLVLKHKDFIEFMGANVDNVHGIVKNHMRIKQMDKMDEKKKAQMRELKTFEKLQIFTQADSMLKEFKYK